MGKMRNMGKDKGDAGECRGMEEFEGDEGDEDDDKDDNEYGKYRLENEHEKNLPRREKSGG